MKSIKEQIEFLSRGTSQIINHQELENKLKLKRPLRVKLGVDPTAADVTLGWAVVLRKLRDFQTLGHTACLIIGDFTASIGDPSGKSKTRKQLTSEEIKQNVDSVLAQFFKILDKDKTEVLFNNDWLGKMQFKDIMELASRYTVARLLERDDFAKRIKEEKPIAMHELMYPLCQGYDSVHIKADVELGGNDQLFNNLVGRTLMGQYGMEPQVVMLCPLMVGTDGKEKMSQSLANYISIIDTPNEIYGKTMSIPDDLITNWYELATDVPTSEINQMAQQMKEGVLNPRDAKRKLAKEIVSLYHNKEEAENAERYFIETFTKRNQPVEAEEATIPQELIQEGEIALPALISKLGMAKSNSEARRLMSSGAVSIDNQKYQDPIQKIHIKEIDNKILRVGKKQFKRLIMK